MEKENAFVCGFGWLRIQGSKNFMGNHFWSEPPKIVIRSLLTPIQIFYTNEIKCIL